MDGAVLDQADGFFEGIPRGAGGVGGRLPGGVAFFPADEAEVDAVGLARVGEAADDVFRPEAGGVASGESEDGARGHAQ